MKHVKDVRGGKEEVHVQDRIWVFPEWKKKAKRPRNKQTRKNTNLKNKLNLSFL